MNVHLSYQPQEEARLTLREGVDPIVKLSWGSEIPQDRKIDILVDGRPEEELIETLAGTGLKALIIPWAGVPAQTRKLMEGFPAVQVYNLHHNAAATAELTVSLLLAAVKRIILYDRALRKNNWSPRYQSDQALLLAGKTALILGYGEIGRRVGDILRAMGIAVRAVRRHPGRNAEEGIPVFSPGQLAELLPEAHFLILTLPLTPETRGMIGEKELGLLPENAVLVNVSRGPIVDQKALYQVLSQGKLFGAGLDVWYNYPDAPEKRDDTSPADYPFQEMDQVVLSPHRGGKSPHVETLRMTALAESLNAAVRGEAVPNAVDIELGY